MPGQDSGRSLVDILYGRINPGGKTPFTWGTSREAISSSLLTQPNNGDGAPQDNFDKGVLIDYRRFDKYNKTSIYEFGFGLSYTTFEFSDLRVPPLGGRDYRPTTGETKAAPVLGEVGRPSDYLFPSGLRCIRQYLYPWLNSTDLRQSSGDPVYGMKTEDYVRAGATDGSPQALLPASGPSGGNPLLFEEIFNVHVSITNTGSVDGDEVPQLYVSLGGEEDPVRVLRQFDRIAIAAGETLQWQTTLTRRDISNWDTYSQNWIVSDASKRIFVGSSSRNLPLSAELPPTH